ncbi:MAG: WD40 repeat protein, partial [Bacillariaceae sp.]
NNNNTSGDINMNNNKRPMSAKKGPKKGKSSTKQQRTVIAPQQQVPSTTSTQQDETPNPSTSLSTSNPLAAPQNSGFASLLEAASTDGDGGGGGASQHQEYQQQQQDVTMSDAPNGSVEESSDHRPHHRHLQHRHNVQHHSQSNSLLNQLQSQVASSRSELSSQQAAAVQDLMTMNGKHMQGERHFNNGGTEQHQQQIPNGPISSSQNALVSSSSAISTTTQIAPKEAAKAVDTIIDKEDELTNADLSEVLELKMHQSEVFMCAWNSVFTDMIATGSGDASARIWQMGGPKASNGLGPVKLLPHGTGPRDRKNKDVTTLEWSSDGKLLATGSYDGVARVWSLNGALVHTLRGHKGPIFSLKWNKKGNYLLSGSYDKTTIVWDVSNGSGFIKQQFEDHQAPALDVDWKDDNTFASCSTDKTVHICRVGSEKPLKTYTGHTDEVNAVKWDPSGSLLASCSDDCTAKVWDVNSDRKDPMYDFKSHQQEIYTVKW